MSEYVKIETAIGTSRLEIELDEGFIDNERYEWGSELLHNHAMYEVHLVERGSCVMHVDKRDVKLTAPMLCVIPPGVYHAQFSARSGEVGKCCFRFFAISETGGERGPRLSELPFFVAPAEEAISLLVQAIRSELEGDSWGSRLKVQALFTALLVDIARLAPRAPLERVAAADLHAVERRTDQIDQYFADRYNAGPSEGELAELLHMSTRQLNRVLKNRYGVSFRHKLMETRLNHAMDLLIRSSLPIADIATQVGYESSRSFYAAFKAYTGNTPAAYRESAEKR